ncbi:kinase-like protein [Lindgomyces ingoldianus]|uniref:Kinase-like protein n=1 Tax=Lindgomyces ingoldianus TaxID=673940 RepID=A0ACB6QZQ2_9PLEO|nr:kinase-like protein [Lindgomyces ingoldianus]KAF2471545.1 kinase-like protein [Lindgomyces ingoldianus]
MSNKRQTSAGNHNFHPEFDTPTSDAEYNSRPMASTPITLSGAPSRAAPVSGTPIQESEHLEEALRNARLQIQERDNRISSLELKDEKLEILYHNLSKESRRLRRLLHNVADFVKSSQVAEDHRTFPPLSPSGIEDAYETDQLPLSVRDDWSGRGSHATFTHEETIPLERGRALGYGANGEVVEVTCKGVKLALKKIYHRYGIQNNQMKEIDILKDTKHRHIVRLVGTFTQRPYLGLLIWPVARCDLSVVFEVMDMRRSYNQDFDQDRRLSEKLADHCLNANEFRDIVGQKEERMWSIFGCLTATMAYLHRNNIRHKDIKPSNILLSPDGLWLTDFGAAKNFTSDLTSTSESRERGTLRYCAPEVSNYKESGRSADIFSLGCVFLETVVVLTQNHTLAELAELRPSKNKSYEANLDRIDQWLALAESSEAKTQHLLYEIKQMLNPDRTRRPSAKSLALRISGIDQYNGRELPKRLHGSCCDRWSERELNVHKERIEKLEREKQGYESLRSKIHELVGSVLHSG